MFHLYNDAGTSYNLAPYFTPTSIFEYEKDLQLTRSEGATNNTIKGDGYYKPKPLVLTCTRRFHNVTTRDSEFSSLDAILTGVKYLIFESTTIYLQSGYYTAQANDTALDVTIKLNLFPRVTNYPSYTGGIIYWGYTTDYTFADTTTTFA